MECRFTTFPVEGGRSIQNIHNIDTESISVSNQYCHKMDTVVSDPLFKFYFIFVLYFLNSEVKIIFASICSHDNFLYFFSLENNAQLVLSFYWFSLLC